MFCFKVGKLCIMVFIKYQFLFFLQFSALVSYNFRTAISVIIILIRIFLLLPQKFLPVAFSTTFVFASLQTVFTCYMCALVMINLYLFFQNTKK